MKNINYSLIYFVCLFSVVYVGSNIFLKRDMNQVVRKDMEINIEPTITQRNKNDNNQNGSCVANSHLLNGECWCDDGYTLNNSTNQCDPCPPNTWGKYSFCYCNDGYTRKDKAEICQPCPDNSTGKNSECYCNKGYKKNISTGKCDKIDSLPVKVGQCTIAIVEKVGYRLEDIDGTPIVTSGSSILYTNGGYQVDYDEVPGIVNSRPNDEVILCLVSIPKNCPPGDDRGRVYKAKNKRTGDVWEEADSQHSCGGA